VEPVGRTRRRAMRDGVRGRRATMLDWDLREWISTEGGGW
jgi:hypothetical protein